MIDGGYLKINLAKIDTILKLPITNNLTKIITFMRSSQYLIKYIASFLVMTMFRDATIGSAKSF
jgi:hypothetical protein